ncbi:hypothetical protein HPP92_008745 [Vanilla planifolia]|uniref:RING-type E3 ubiquitin transferase n=1 Tax=Vanilla planifolia TaxID=51239 RepID=A0A835R8N0_VANPL|nr:hypothetical protein HPP92_008745 [Vanilla planifolia]
MVYSIPRTSGVWVTNRSNESSPQNVWIPLVFIGGVLSLILLLFAAHHFTRYIILRRRRREQVSNDATNRLYSGHPRLPAGGGVDAAIIATLPTFFHGKRVEAVAGSDGGGGELCAVCLSVAKEAEAMRLLPNCKHVFHVGCIDSWLNAHRTCPVCRAEVTRFAQPEAGGGGPLLAALPTSERVIVRVEVPSRSDEKPLPKEGSSVVLKGSSLFQRSSMGRQSSSVRQDNGGNDIVPAQP